MVVLVAPTALLALVDDRHAKERVHAVGDARDDARYITPMKFVLLLHYFCLKPALRLAQGPSFLKTAAKLGIVGRFTKREKEKFVPT